MIEYNHFQSPIGFLTILSIKKGVIKISYTNSFLQEMENWSQSHLGIRVSKGTDFSNQARVQILNYLSGKGKLLDFPVVHINSPFQKKVLEAERKIPYGETRSYGEVALMISNPKASRAVGSANAKNPLPLYYPCHRIIYSDGRLGGFGWGLEVKEWLLNLEARQH